MLNDVLIIFEKCNYELTEVRSFHDMYCVVAPMAKVIPQTVNVRRTTTTDQQTITSEGIIITAALSS